MFNKNDSPGASLPPKRSIGCVETMSATTTVQGSFDMTDLTISAVCLIVQPGKKRVAK